MLLRGRTVVRLKGFQKLTSTNDALKTWLNILQIKRCRAINTPLQKTLNHVLAIDIIANEDLPRFNKSAVDGYALISENTTGASQFKPIILQITRLREIKYKQASLVWTGAPIPRGANAVVMIENTKRHNGELEVWVQLAPGDNVSKRGEDVKKGETAVKAGTRLKSYHLGLLAALGNDKVEIVERPKIAIFATGNELAEVGSKPSGNQIFESNRTILSAMCYELGAEPVDLGIAKDDLNEIADNLRTGLRSADIVLTTGGTSVGGLDLVPKAVRKVGKPGVVVHGMALRPGMPTALAVLEGKPVLILSGNPVAAIIGFEVFARPLIGKMFGMNKEEPRPVISAIMTRKVATALGRKSFIRVRVLQKNGKFLAEPVSVRGSGAISTMTRSNGFVIVPENREGVLEGEIVTVQMFGNIEAVNENV
jgi:molybdopterin molybdotransferase